MAQGALTAAGAGEEVVPASQYRALESQVRGLQRLLGKKTMENEVLREAVTRAVALKNCCCARARGRKGAQRAPQPLPPEFRARISPARDQIGTMRVIMSVSLRGIIGIRTQPQTRLPGDEAARSAPPARRHKERTTPPRWPGRSRYKQHQLVPGRARNRLRQWREGPHRLRPRLLRSGSDRLCRYECRD